MNRTNETITNEPSSFYKSFTVVIVVVQVMIILAATCGNLLVCLAICVSKNLRETASNYLIFSLAISDILTANLSMPFDIEEILKNYRWDHGPAICTLRTTVYLITVPTSILSLLAVSVDRYKAISDPLNRFRRSRFLTRKRAACVVAGLWLYSIIFALIPNMGLIPIPFQPKSNECIFNTPVPYSILNSCLNFYLPLFLMVIIYFRIYKIANKMNTVLEERTRQLIGNHLNPARSEILHRAPPCPSTEDGHETAALHQDSPSTCPVKMVKRQRQSFNRSIKTAKSILVIVCAFFLCWVPFTTFSVVSLLCKRCYLAVNPYGVHEILLTMGYLNSALNPPLYSFHNPKFIEAFRKILRLNKRRIFRGADSTLSAPSLSGSKLKTSLTMFYSRRSTTENKRLRFETTVNK